MAHTSGVHIHMKGCKLHLKYINDQNI